VDNGKEEYWVCLWKSGIALSDELSKGGDRRASRIAGRGSDDFCVSLHPGWPREECVGDLRYICPCISHVHYLLALL
jgi:hypothetical protein